MRIAFIVDAFPKLSESFVVKQITGLLDMGHDVYVFANVDPHDSEISAEVLEYSLVGRTTYVNSGSSNKHVRRLKILARLFCKSFVAPRYTTRAMSKLLSDPNGFSYQMLNYTMAFIGKQFDAVHCHFGPAGIIGAFLKSVGFDFRLVSTFHGYDVTTYVQQNGNDVYQQLFELGDVFTYNSEATKQKVIALGCPVERMVKIPMGIELGTIKFSPREIEPDGRIEVLSVGRLVEMKGREYAIKAVARAAKKFPGLRYNIVGDGPLRQSLEYLIKELGLEDTVTLLGWVSSSKLDDLYDSAHIFLHPSVKAGDGNMEGQGVVLLEAQARGIPILATLHSAFPETVVDGKSGFLVPERDVDALAERLEFLLANPELWPNIGIAGRQHAEKYDIDHLNRRLIEVYSQAV